ncbi:hypothetical protein BDV97DRAFT_398242 [Delphinella strobiligena]|nr:hypothetical protein BDV97DRAFT_398242 [Delphinella strobiligena]
MLPILPHCRTAIQLLAAVRPLKRPLYPRPSPANAYPSRVAIRSLSADPGEPLSRKASRYKIDPIYRERIKASSRSLYRENAGDRKLAQMRLRYHADDERRLERLERVSERRRRLPPASAWAKQRHCEQQAIRYLVLKQVSSCPDIEWASHIPVHNEERTQVSCSGCNQLKRLKLFWERRAEPEKYDCHTCFTSDADRKWPIGYVKRRLHSTARDKTPVASHAHTSVTYSSPAFSNVPRRTTTTTVPTSHRHCTSVVTPSVPGSKRSFSTMRRLCEQQARGRGRGRPPTLRTPEEEAARKNAIREYSRTYHRERRATDADYRTRRAASAKWDKLRKLESDPMDLRRQQLRYQQTYVSKKMESDPNYAKALQKANQRRCYKYYHKKSKSSSDL